MPSHQNIKQQLIDLRADYTRRINAIDDDVHHKSEPVEKDFAEQATQRENDDVLNALESDAKQTVILIDRALLKIENGSYGSCAECGDDISAARLKTIPFATLCIKCADKVG